MKPAQFVSALLLLGGAVCAQQPAGDVHVLRVQGGIYMVVGGGGNIAVQAGKDGILLVDTGLTELAPKVLAAVRTISDGPVRYILNTHVHADHTGGNEYFVKQGGALNGVPGEPRVIAHLAVQERMAGPPVGNDAPMPRSLWPNDTYSTPFKDFFFNNEPVFVYHAPAAHTDGDSIVLFRRSDVVSTGDIFTPGRYPFIDLQRGGSVQGLIAGLNKILELAVPARYQEGGTYIIPGHGRLCDEADVVEFRDMVTIIRDRVQDSIKKGMTLEQVKSARPSFDYDTQYSGSADAFVESIYKSLKR
ncbi:MAG: MBL fold metallo-hydrolase [Bryobacterales bacterium]|nr:MBL fold metallo-hydrolase [Bryobacterales bacterium]MBV9397968.1 MBL fold metallo-hydrolase [Bryobacterales bacterium]